MDAQKKGVYDVFSNINNTSGQIYNDLGNLQSDYLNNPVQVYQNIMDSYKEKFGTTFDKNSALNQNYNKLAAQGLDPHSALGSYEQQSIQNKIEDDAKQNYYNQIMGIQNQGIGLGQNLVSQGLGAGQNLVGGLQGDQNLAIQQQQLEMKQQEAKQGNDWLGAIGRRGLGQIAGYAAQGIGTAFGGPLGGMIGGALAKGIIGKIGNQ